MRNTSLWQETSKFKNFHTLDKDITTDAVIIGGGMTGLLCAYLLKEDNINCVVIEQGKIASGVTAHTTGKITAQHGLVYDKLINDVGESKARQYLNANIQAFQNYKRIIFKDNIDCDFEECPNVVYTLENPTAIENEIIALKKLGMTCEIVTETTLPFEIRCGVKTYYSGHFNPLKFLSSISENLDIYENTKAIKIKGHKVITDNGTITTKNIIVASHFPIKDTPGFYFARMSQDTSYLSAIKWAKKMDAMYVDENDVGMTFRNYKNYLLVGGLDHRTGENDGLRFEALKKKIEVMYPRASIEYMWCTEDCMPVDNVPLIGQYSVFTPNLYVATGYKKWGMSTSMAAAMIITDKIRGLENENASVFSPQRFLNKSAVKETAKNTKIYITGFNERIFGKTSTNIYDIKKNDGRIVKIDGKKQAVFCDNSGQYHMFEAKCNHLGCKLTFNADDKSWDCPCHGSKYDIDGKIICNPAN